MRGGEALSKPTKTEYTPEELVEVLRSKMNGATLAMASAEIGLSVPMLQQILTGRRSVGNEKVLAYLSPPGKQFEFRERYVLVEKQAEPVSGLLSARKRS